MGLSIYYNGRFKKGASLSGMIDEVKDIAEIYNWKYHIFETEFNPEEFEKDFHDRNIYGISFSPPKCEPIDLTFLSNGKMCSSLFFEFYSKAREKEEYAFTIFSKTQYAGYEKHKIIIDLIRYLDKKYFKEFKLTDESRYWETGDEEILRKNFKKYDDMIDQFSDKLKNIPKKENESIEDFVKRLTKMLKFKRE